MITVIILTKDEEKNIAKCIESCSWCDDVIVFDSFSNDNTVSIAQDLGARVHSRHFDNYSAQRNAALLVEKKHDWVLFLDADETPDEELIHEMQAAVSSNSVNVSAYRMRRKDFFMGRWVKHSTLYPTWFVRLLRSSKASYEPRKVHEYPIIQGEVSSLNGHLLHDSFSKGLSEWFQKHVKYASLEAEEGSLPKAPVGFRMGMLGDPVHRRRIAKSIAYRLPFRPTMRFLYSFVFRLGFLDGYPGYCYSRMMAIYEEMIVIQMRFNQVMGKGGTE